ncbi:glycosyltransferase family 4 protein [Lysobacter sp. GCM10012299]|uniref:glycosyltransferase family 4 protein n=1 Tax=Lysobacter sp. GCM10012299 TaxID=3317333 RepID=UPI0036207B49
MPEEQTSRVEGIDTGPSPNEAWRLRMALVSQIEAGRRKDAVVDTMLASRSWRLTAPFRSLVRLLKSPQVATSALPLQPGAKGTGQTLGACIDALVQEAALPAWMARPVFAGQPRLLVDVTELSLEDLGGGVQRVTRQLLGEMLADPHGFAIEPVRIASDHTYVHARAFTSGLLGLAPQALGVDFEVKARPGDVLLGLDFCRPHHLALAAALPKLRHGGARVALFVHDVLPLQHPDWFPEAVPEQFERWLAVFSEHADLALVNSEATARSLESALRDRALPGPSMGQRVILLGADAVPDVAAPSPLPERATGTTRVLMVGTIEPRKGHAQVLDAMERLWANGEHFELVIVGRQGWKTSELGQRLRGHPQQGRRLHWFEGADDYWLASLYRDCDVLVMASSDEGFGLPIVEAGRAGCGLLLRDIPVFREIAGDAAEYFEGNDTDAMAQALRRWSRPRNDARRTRPWIHWRQSADAVLGACADLVEATGEQLRRSS